MLKKILACGVVTIFVLVSGVVVSFGTDNGPEEITLVGSKSKKPKPAIFPHKMHQESIGCGECHHSMADDGKQIPYAEGQEVGTCESCHNKDVLAGKKSGKLKLDTIKGAGHGNCLACHKKMAKENPDLKAKKIAKCATCHPKKK